MSDPEIIYKFSCPYCGKVFEGSKSKFDECFKHIARNKKCSHAHNVDPCYPINHCTITKNGKTYSYLP